MPDIASIVQNQHLFFDTGNTKPISFRIKQLKKLKALLGEYEAEIFDALKEDFNKPHFETFGTELGILYDEINLAVKKLPSWVKPEKKRGTLVTFPSRSRIYSQPYGVALVIGAWNYPVQLSLNPVIGAIAAGNCAVLKPAELAAASSSVLKTMINSHFEPGFLRVVEGGAAEARHLLDQPLDYIFFTGSEEVGKKVMKAAARQLTPVTLELGGKSPAIVDNTADLETAARRITWGKFINAGQTCIAPDYVYVNETVSDQLKDYMVQAIHDFYGPDPSKSPDYARIIDDKHYARLAGLMEDVHIVVGGKTAKEDLYVSPTIIDKVDWTHPLMQEEIFGPLLPVLEFKNMEEVITEVNNRPSPLSLYIFTSKSSVQREIIEKIPFGGGCINDTAFHFGNNKLPFGGIGSSGFGTYHGKSSFDLFSHKKSILKKPTWPDFPIRYAPYDGKLKWLKKIFR